MALDWRDMFKRYRDAREGGYVDYEQTFTEEENAAIDEIDRETREEANGMTDEQVARAFRLDCPPALPGCRYAVLRARLRRRLPWPWCSLPRRTSRAR